MKLLLTSSASTRTKGMTGLHLHHRIALLRNASPFPVDPCPISLLQILGFRGFVVVYMAAAELLSVAQLTCFFKLLHKRCNSGNIQNEFSLSLVVWNCGLNIARRTWLLWTMDRNSHSQERCTQQHLVALPCFYRQENSKQRALQ